MNNKIIIYIILDYQFFMIIFFLYIIVILKIIHKKEKKNPIQNQNIFKIPSSTIKHTENYYINDRNMKLYYQIYECNAGFTD